MKTAKDEVRKLFETLPDESSLEDIQYQIYVRQKNLLSPIESARNGLLDSLSFADSSLE